MKILHFVLILICMATTVPLVSQNSSSILSSINDRAQLREESLLKDYPVRNIGPTVQGGRITDIEVDPRNTNTFYVGYASGGIFKTTTNGVHFEPVFDHCGALGIGDLAISPSNPDIIWAGTGENNSSRSSYAGSGMYKSTDAGKTWSAAGLAGSQHIGRIICHPSDENIVWVASIGALYSKNEDRGVFKTSDGGKSWQKTLFVDAGTGVIDLTIDPSDPNRLYAAAWDRIRKAWQFTGEGKGSAIYRSENGGDTWRKSIQGFPQNEKTGRIGLAVSPSNPKVVYAVLDNQSKDESSVKEDTVSGLTLRDFLDMTKAELLDIDDERLDTFLTEMGFPKKYNGELVKQEIEAGDYEPKALGEYFGDANKALFSAAIKGTEVYRSNNYGKTWKRTHEKLLTGTFFTYGYYFGQIRVSPDNPDQIYIFGVPLLKSDDAGQSWNRLDTLNIHVDHHALWIDPQDASHILLGNDGGLYQTYDRGLHWLHLNNISVGQFYTVSVDDAEPYNVYGGLQDNGVYMASSKFKPNRGHFWKKLFGGDGMFVALDHRNPSLVYTGYQFGHYYRMDRNGGKPKYITPKHDIGDARYRFNWRTPVKTSPHTPEILYMGSQYLFRSLDMGDSFEKISPDLTGNMLPQGNVPYSTLTTISESPLKFGLIWTGSDDGFVNVSKDGGNNWANVSQGLPKGLWVTKIEASPHDEASAFVSLSGYRSDDFHTYLFKTDDYGKSWISLKGNLSEEAVNCIIQDPENENLLFCGTDFALYASLNGGQSWEMTGKLPNVAMYDLVVQEKAKELVIATHGRSIYIMDIDPLQQIAGDNLSQGLIALGNEKLTWSKKWGSKTHPYSLSNEPKVRLNWYAGTVTEEVWIKIVDQDSKVLTKWKTNGTKGFRTAFWDLKSGSGKNAKYVKPGDYKAEITIGDVSVEILISIKEPKK